MQNASSINPLCWLVIIGFILEMQILTLLMQLPFFHGLGIIIDSLSNSFNVNFDQPNQEKHWKWNTFIHWKTSTNQSISWCSSNAYSYIPCNIKVDTRFVSHIFTTHTIPFVNAIHWSNQWINRCASQLVTSTLCFVVYSFFIS